MFRYPEKDQRFSKNAAQKISAKIKESIIQLQAMRDYARDNEHNATEKKLNEVVEIFSQLQRVLDPAKANEEIKRAKFVLSQAKISMHAEKAQIFSSLRQSTFQNIFDNMKNFFSPHSKFEDVIEKLEKLGKIKQPATENTTATLIRFFKSNSLELKKSPPKGSPSPSSKSYLKK